MSDNLLVWHYGYADVAIGQYERLRKLMSRPQVEYVALSQPADYRFSEAASCYTSVIVYAEMAIDAYINYYGIDGLGKSFYLEYRDRLSLKARWVLVPQLRTGKKFPRDRRGFRLLCELIKSRNVIVHTKPKKIGAYPNLKLDIPDPRLYLDSAQEAVNAMQALYDDLATIDSGAPSIIRGGNPGQ